MRDVTTAWQPAGPAGAVPEGTLRRVEVEGRAVCLGLTPGGWAAFDDTCTHEDCSLADGELDGTVVVCPCHGSEFDVRSGDVLSPPALEPLPIYDVRVEAGELLVRLAAPAAAAAATRERAGHLGHAREPAGHVPGTPSLAEIDLTDLDVWERGVPHEWFATLRREAPLHWQEERDGRGFWVFSRYDDVVAVSKDFATYSSEVGGTSLQDLTAEEVEARKSMIDTDPPAHTRLRALVNRGFTPKVVNAYEERIRTLAREIMRQASAKGELDWVAEVAAEIPMWVFSAIMGLPVEDRRLLIELGDKLLGNSDPEVVGPENVAERTLSDPELRKLPFSSPFATELIEYGRRLGEARRSDPRDDVTTRLVEADLDGSRLDEREFGVFFILLTTAGNETTRHAISLGLLALLQQPAQRARLAADPRLAARAADEVLRFATPVHHFRRTATRDVTVHGREIRAGDKVTMWYSSGNFDEERFPEPLRFDVGRTPNRHLTFGLGGPHFCLGAHLARLELRVWLEELIPYLDRIELAGEPVRLRSNFFNGIKRLPVRVRGAA